MGNRHALNWRRRVLEPGRTSPARVALELSFRRRTRSEAPTICLAR